MQRNSNKQGAASQAEASPDHCQSCKVLADYFHKRLATPQECAAETDDIIFQYVFDLPWLNNREKDHVEFLRSVRNLFRNLKKHFSKKGGSND